MSIWEFDFDRIPLDKFPKGLKWFRIKATDDLLTTQLEVNANLRQMIGQLELQSAAWEKIARPPLSLKIVKGAPLVAIGVGIAYLLR